MRPWLLLTLGVINLFLGFGYLYRPDLIERLNTFIKDVLLNDSHVTLERKQWGVFFLLISFLFLYMGIHGVHG
jgi:hypothetical protein